MFKTLVLLLLTYFSAQAWCQNLSSCFEDFEFIYFDQPVNQATSKAECVNNNATLASITSSQQLTFVRDFIRPIITRVTYFGLERLPEGQLGNQNPQNPSVYSFIDGLDYNDTDPDFGQIRGREPWGQSRPNNSGGLDQRCAIIQDNNALNWDDVSCGLNRNFICKRSCTQIVEQDNDEEEQQPPLEPVDDEDDNKPGERNERQKQRKGNIIIGVIFFVILFLITLIVLIIKMNTLKKTIKQQEMLMMFTNDI